MAPGSAENRYAFVRSWVSNATVTLERILMAQDKQLCGIELNDVLEKRRLDQALNAKEFAVLAGISYSAARAWFRLPGLPVIHGLVFWDDFVQWRRTQTGLVEPNESGRSRGMPSTRDSSSNGIRIARRVAELLSEVS